ncbi:unnamed protein product [Protopolystoma xenopodis]|uniref:Uncharacterized protein n=1 Tax=Protopolystoma xenopodis TaxID=117903 RepID=A0A3S5A0V1_9PLAT|nr:unnamed protein product [Protopolystoma xenopodis]
MDLVHEIGVYTSFYFPPIFLSLYNPSQSTVCPSSFDLQFVEHFAGRLNDSNYRVCLTALSCLHEDFQSPSDQKSVSQDQTRRGIRQPVNIQLPQDQDLTKCTESMGKSLSLKPGSPSSPIYTTSVPLGSCLLSRFRSDLTEQQVGQLLQRLAGALVNPVEEIRNTARAALSAFRKYLGELNLLLLLI